MSRRLLRALTAEAIGTFALVFAGCGAFMVDARPVSSAALTRDFPWPRALAYRGAQLRGALAAAALLRASLGNIAHVGATFPSGSDGRSFL